MFLVGLDYAIKQKFKVINLSLGTTKRDFFGRCTIYSIAPIRPAASSYPQQTICLTRAILQSFPLRWSQ